MIILNDIEDNKLLKHTSVGQESTFGSAMRAGITETLVRSPFSSLFRAVSLHAEEMFPTGRFFTEEEFKNSEHFRPGLSFPKGVRESVAKLVAERKDAELERAKILSRAPSGFLNKAGLFGVNLVSAMLDPLNVATAFVPVVSQARFAQLSSSIGVTGARLGRGLSQGFVGSTLVEPLILGSAIQEQADYTMADSLLNIGFGTVLGGGIHAIGGKIADIVRGYSIKSRQKIMEGVVSDMVQGKVPRADIRAKMAEIAETDPVLNSEISVSNRADSFDLVRNLLKSENEVLTDADLFARLSDIFVKDKNKLSPIELEILDKVENTPQLRRLQDILTKRKEDITDADKSVLDTFRKATPERQQELRNELSKIDEAISKAKSRKPRSEQAKKQKVTKIKNLEKKKESINKELTKLKKVEEQYKTLPKYKTENEMLKDVQNHHDPKSDSQYDVSAKEQLEDMAQEKLSIEEQLKDMEDQIKSLKESGLINEKDLKVLEDVEQSLKNAEKSRGLIETLALCATRG